MTPLQLNLGAGQMPIAGYLSVDSQPYDGIDVVARIPPIPYEDGTVDAIYAGHVLEHILPVDVLPFLVECYRVLRLGGTLTVVTPDSDKARLLVESRMLHPTVYAEVVSGARYDDMPHACLFNQERLRACVERAGFVIDVDYDWRNDDRVYDRSVLWQCGIRGMKA